VFKTPQKMPSIQMSGEDLFKTPVKTPPKKSSTQMSEEDLSKTPVKTSSIQMSGESRDEMLSDTKTPSIPISGESREEVALDFFKTPVKTPRKITSFQMTGESRNEVQSDHRTPVKKPQKTPSIPLSGESRDEVAFDIFKTPGKTPRKTPGKDTQGEARARKTPLNKLKKKSPMPSPFLLSPGTPSKDISIASISFNQSEHFMVTPSVQDPYDENSLTLEISPSGSLHTPSPQSQDRDDPLITPPLEQVTTPDNTYGEIVNVIQYTSSIMY